MGINKKKYLICTKNRIKNCVIFITRTVLTKNSYVV